MTVTKDDTIILDGAGSKDAIQERCGHIRDAAEQTTSDYDRDKLHERLAKLSGGVAVLKIGGASEVGSHGLQMIRRTSAYVAYYMLCVGPDYSCSCLHKCIKRTASPCLRRVPGSCYCLLPF